MSQVPYVAPELPIRSAWGNALADRINAREPAWPGAPAMVGGPPPPDADFLEQAGQALLQTDPAAGAPGEGWNYIVFAYPFPRGLLSLTVRVSQDIAICATTWEGAMELGRVGCVCYWWDGRRAVGFVWVNWRAVGW